MAQHKSAQAFLSAVSANTEAEPGEVVTSFHLTGWEWAG